MPKGRLRKNLLYTVHNYNQINHSYVLPLLYNYKSTLLKDVSWRIRHTYYTIRDKNLVKVALRKRRTILLNRSTAFVLTKKYEAQSNNKKCCCCVTIYVVNCFIGISLLLFSGNQTQYKNNNNNSSSSSSSSKKEAKEAWGSIFPRY